MPQTTPCPSAEDLKRLVLGRVSEQDAERLSQNLLQCDACRQRRHALEGRDTLNFAATDAAAAGSGGVDIYGGQVNVTLLGGQDNDTLSARHFGELDRSLSFSVAGGSGRDSIDLAATFLADSGYTDGPNGTRSPLPQTPQFSAQVFGEGDRDQLNVSAFRRGSANVATNALVDGGSQRDTCSTTGGNIPVTVLNCP